MTEQTRPATARENAQACIDAGVPAVRGLTAQRAARLYGAGLLAKWAEEFDAYRRAAGRP